MRVLVLVLVPAAACTHHAATPDASTMLRQTVTDQETLLPGMLIEGSWLAGPGDQVGLTLSTTVAGMDWDIHGHANNGTQEIVSGFAQMSATYMFEPPQQAQWYLLVRNSASSTLTIDVAMDLYGGAQWVGWQ